MVNCEQAYGIDGLRDHSNHDSKHTSMFYSCMTLACMHPAAATAVAATACMPGWTGMHEPACMDVAAAAAAAATAAGARVHY